MQKRIRPRCYNCKFKGDYFKLGKLNHCHCQHPSEKENMNPWDTLREFWSTCPKHEFIDTLNTNFMSFENRFNMYAASTELARLKSRGSGDLNKFDHLAKDFHEPTFDEVLEETEQWRLNALRSEYEAELTQLANERYSTEE